MSVTFGRAIDAPKGGGSGIVPYLPLGELQKPQRKEGSN